MFVEGGWMGGLFGKLLHKGEGFFSSFVHGKSGKIEERVGHRISSRCFFFFDVLDETCNLETRICSCRRIDKSVIRLVGEAVSYRSGGRCVKSFFT